MARLFIALDLPEAARDALADIAQNLPGADWVYSEQYHLTLRFIGDADADAFHAIRQGLGSVVSPAFFLSLRGVGVFPLRGDPITLWAGAERREELLHLRHKVESVLTRNGLPPETRKFFPHITLAKIKSCREKWVGGYLAHNSLFAIPEVPVQAFGLYSSRLTPEGAIHTLEATYPLQGLLDPG
ncbi:MAG: RNA 2',3'-cyclic phosphodiesterase [Fibrobacteria bacterium]